MIDGLMSLGTATLMRSLGARRRHEEICGADMVVNELGPPGGEPWVLLHGMGSTSAAWAPVIRRLKRDCRLLVPELSALGGSHPPASSLNVREGVEVVGELIRTHFDDRPVTLAGISLGGWIAIRLALARPTVADRLLLVNCAGYRDQDWERIERLVRVEDLDGVDRLYRALFHRTPLPMRLARRGLLAAYRSPSVRHVIETLRLEDSFDAEDLGRLDMPVGLVWSEEDGLFEPEVGVAMAAALPHCGVQRVPRCGHAIHWERPRALLEATVRFRDSTPG